MAVSIKDIAKLAGVSHSTVSRALHGSPLIPQSTANRIRTIAEELGYTASAIGRGLVSGRTHSIGVVVTSIADPFNGEVVEGLEDYANEHGYSIILATSQGMPEREITVVKSFQSRRVDGIIVASSRVGSSYFEHLAEMQIPVVLLNNQHPNEASYSVCVDNRRGAFDAASHLLKLGHGRIAYLGDKSGLHSDTERMAGFEHAMREAGVAVDRNLILSGDGKVGGAAYALRSFAERNRLPTAIMCYNDMSAVGVFQCAKQLNIRIPNELSIVGFDDILAAEFLGPGLTTIRQPKRELGMHSMEMMLRILRGEETARGMTLPGKLIVRGSTAPLAIL